ncbi:hypothetical protein Hdeb2414_s0012g00392071 [Helianthus debilis subsp. tardiflorus]
MMAIVVEDDEGKVVVLAGDDVHRRSHAGDGDSDDSGSVRCSPVHTVCIGLQSDLFGSRFGSTRFELVKPSQLSFGSIQLGQTESTRSTKSTGQRVWMTRSNRVDSVQLRSTSESTQSMATSQLSQWFGQQKSKIVNARRSKV